MQISVNWFFGILNCTSVTWLENYVTEYLINHFKRLQVSNELDRMSYVKFYIVDF